MGIQNIEKYSFRYSLLKFYGKFWHDKIFYKKVAYINVDSVPWNEHLIFTPNHQNALMDALAVEYARKNQFIFVARSDIFKNKFIAGLLYFLKILPVYRIRDGYESLKKNEETFNKTLDIIRNKNGFVIMPEGNHAAFRRLRQLKKGFARIAYQAEEATDYSLDIKIIPVGINYNCYDKYRSEMLVIFGKPISVAQFFDDYKENPPMAYNKIKDVLADQIKPLMIHIESEKYYEAFDALRHLFEKKAAKQLNLKISDLYQKFKTHQDIIDALEQEENSGSTVFKDLIQKTESLIKNNKALKFDAHSSWCKKAGNPGILFGEIILLLLGFPIFIYGFINHVLPYLPPFILTNKVKDKQFHSSFKYGLTLFLFPIFYVLQPVVFYLISGNALWSWIYLLSLPLTGILAWAYSRLYLSTVKNLKHYKFKIRKNERYLENKTLYAHITNLMDQIFQKNHIILPD